MKQAPGAATARFHMTTTDMQVVSMQITAHGFGSKVRLLPLADSIHSTLSKELSVAFNPSSEGLPYGEVSLEHFAGVTSIDVDEVGYENGTSWHASPGKTCTVIPDGFMLVNGR